MISKNFQKLTTLASIIAAMAGVFSPNLARAYHAFDNRNDWEGAVSNYSIITEDFNSVFDEIAPETLLPSTLVTKIPFTVNAGLAESDWAAFDIVFPDEAIAFGFDMIDPWRSPNRDAILGNVKFFDRENNLLNHLGVQFTSYDENFVGFFLGENYGVHRIEYLWCGVWQGPDKPLDYCKSDHQQQTIDNFSFVVPKTDPQPTPESDAKLGLLVFAGLGIGYLRKWKGRYQPKTKLQ
ncbi:MAG: hypothetical protein AAGJ08_05090 [Cyanobacteria bacterium P01_H01_bin.35]